jgi:catechol 2,3-dioxygenase-like lactoylglutathione lyase family enzyme
VTEELENIDDPKSAREQVAEWIGLLVKDHGSQTRLVRALVRQDPSLEGLTREAVSAWVNGRALPEQPRAEALGALLLEQFDGFLGLVERARDERQPETEEVAAVVPRSISVLGIVWLGAVTDDLDSTCEFYEDVLRLHLVHRCEKDHAILRTVNGDYVALYGPKTDRYRLFTTGPVAGFRVGNIAAARAEMEEREVEFLGPTSATDGGRWKYAHFLGPDQKIYELVEEDPWPEGR